MPFTRPSSQDQDQDQDQIRLVRDRSCNKTKVSDHITDINPFNASCSNIAAVRRVQRHTGLTRRF